MSVSGRLQINLTDESRAYGYTLVIWGSGAVLIDAFGFPDPGLVMAYITGAVLGFGALALVVYGNVFRQVENIKEEALIVASSIHFIAALGTIGAAMLFVPRLPELWAFLLAGVNATVTYNVLLLVESIFSREIATKSWKTRIRPGL
ncbi:MAG: hypothetical protein SVU88_02240 [Candidatus Nanohaloarchaea archaeon]|nr:hypothetical protein [Candidatus Nanohaloarchaea archaeon]